MPHLWSEDYRGYATTIWKDSEHMVKTIRDYLKYASAHRTEEQLEQTLGMPTD